MIYLLTFTAYGTHLPRDARGSIDRHERRLAPRPALATFAKALTSEPPFQMDHLRDREALRDEIIRTCNYRQWRLLALHVRIEHVHAVVQAEDVPPTRVIGEWKAYSTRVLEQHWTTRQHFWTSGGDVRHVQGAALASVIRYVLDEQGEFMTTYDASKSSARVPRRSRGRLARYPPTTMPHPAAPAMKCLFQRNHP